MPDSPLPSPRLTHPLHSTASHDHETYSSQRRSLLLRLGYFTSQAIPKAQTRRRGTRRDAHFGKEVEIDLVAVQRISIVLGDRQGDISLPSFKHLDLHQQELLFVCQTTPETFLPCAFSPQPLNLLG